MLFRNRRLARATACFLLLESISSIALPTVSWAFMGPTQAEFTGYEAPGSTDMVNLTTGDLSYSIPILDIPGPERGFSLPLNYKAGIQLEQEASWVGLGWNLNPGAIARSVNGYADDADRDAYVSTYRKDLSRGWTGGVPGVLDLGWNSNSGHSGSVNLLEIAGYGWDKNGGDAEVIGVKMGDKGISVDPINMVQAISSIASLGTTSLVDVGLKVVSTAAMGAFGVGRMGEVNGFMNQPTIETEHHWFYDNYWVKFNNNSTELAYGSLHFDDMSKSVPNSNSPYSLGGYNAADYAGIDPNKASASWNDNQLTPYNIGPTIKMPIATNSAHSFKAKPFAAVRTCDSDGNTTWETAADVSQDIRKGEDAGYYDASTRPLSVAHDNFNVMGESVSGSIRPYRLDVGSIAYPKLGRNECTKHFKYMVVPFMDDYKVPFRYENSLSNGYDYHEYVPASGSTNQPEGINFAAGDKNAGTRGTLSIADPRLQTDGLYNTSRTGPARKGLSTRSSSSPNRQLVQGKHIDWYTNAEIKAMYASSVNGNGNGFLEFAQPTASTGNSPSNNPFRENLPAKGIGAFAVTAEDGTTYHYSLPVYNHKTFSKSTETLYNTTSRMEELLGAPAGEATQSSNQETATSWLLTAITSSDYIDRNNSGTVDREDWGGWVKFEYGKLSSQFTWRQPYMYSSYSDDVPVVNGSPNSNYITSRNFSTGFRDSYYLNSISTRSHTALFVKSVRLDGRGSFDPGTTAASSPAVAASRSLLSIDGRAPAASLRLDEVILLDNQTLDKLQTSDGIRTASTTGSVIPALTNDTGSNAATYTQADVNLNNQRRWFCSNASACANAFSYVSPDGSYSPHDDMGKVLDRHDLDFDVRIREFVNEHALKRVVFNYGYDLCRGTLNSFYYFSSDLANPQPDVRGLTNPIHTRGGKLTLRSVSFFGPSVGETSTKIIPDFVFQYGGDTYIPDNPTQTQRDQGYMAAYFGNPEYGTEKWDGFGMYNESGKYSLTSHQASYYNNKNGAAWSLTKITNPLGGSTQISYERDEYAHVAEFGTARLKLTNTNSSNILEVSPVLNSTANGLGHFDLSKLPEVLKQHDLIPITGKAGFTPCAINPLHWNPDDFPPGPGHKDAIVFRDQVYNATLQEVDAVYYDAGKWYIRLVNTPAPQTPNPNLFPPSKMICASPIVGTGTSVETVVPCNVIGGDIRVASIVTSDENGTPYKIRYKYQKADAPAVSNSSGVLAKEPAFMSRFEHAHYAAFDFPATPVIYSEVTVLRGTFKNDDNDYDQRELYAFHTPVSTMVSQNTPTWRGTGNFYNPDNPINSNIGNIEYWGNNAVVDVGKIGQPRWVKKYNRRGDEELSTTFDYTSSVPNADNIAGQGQFTEGVINNELLDLSIYRINRSTKRYLPSVMHASQSTRNGLSITNTNSLYDFYTGQVLESRFLNSRGETYRSLSVPAYTKAANTSMGAKGENPLWHNMLTQMAASYVYKEQGGASQVVSAGIQTWKNDWGTYRDFIGGLYQNETSTATPVWRENSSYTWQSQQLNPNGTYANFVDFDWSGNPNSHWIKTDETVRYDHYSHALETKDLNNSYTAQKLGYKQGQVIAAASNARYTEMAYSGAEDLLTINGTAHFGGEIIAGGTQDVTKAHTGSASLRLDNNQQGFLYQATGGTDLSIGKPYRVSAWVYNNAAAGNASLYIAINGSITQQAFVSAATTKKSGNWYRLSLVTTLPGSANGQRVTFGCTNAASTAAYFDDFRVCPLTSSMTSRVYDARTNRLTHVLDNENLFTRYEYDKAGKLRQVYKETLDRPNDASASQKLLKEYEYNYARTTAPNWVTMSYRCETNSIGEMTGYELRTEADINPLSATYKAENMIKSVNARVGRCHVCGSDPAVLERFVVQPDGGVISAGGVVGTCYVGVWIDSRLDGCCTNNLQAWSKEYRFGPITDWVSQPPLPCSNPCNGSGPGGVVLPGGPALPRPLHP
ncbi:hypothetical protein [Hymenobacter negativus]|uniref:CBM-cenC domain-containing protein n=1 Tax=Hymenobacter negativus TaxID=2795026 RepID=A0ABS3QED0_9BACT|nr:hypothetical protein [Hymenobacter negativus]MBO2009604.1 hypothetical protein [Hymenobacter negativus]